MMVHRYMALSPGHAMYESCLPSTFYAMHRMFKCEKMEGVKDAPVSPCKCR